MSVSEPTPQSDAQVSQRRLLIAGLVALAGPLAAGIAIAWSRPGHTIRLEGAGAFFGVLVALVVFSAIVAGAARAEHLLVGAMGGVALAVGAFVRDGSVVGALLALVAGFVGGGIAARSKRSFKGPPRGRALLIALTVVLGGAMVPLAWEPPERALAESGLLVFAVDTPSGHNGDGHVLLGSRGDTTDVGTIGKQLLLGRILPRGLGGWTDGGGMDFFATCELPQNVDGVHRPGDESEETIFGEFRTWVATIDLVRACFVPGEGVVGGFGPEGTARIEITTTDGRIVPTAVGRAGAYLISTTTLGPNIARIAFRDARGGLLDSRPSPYGDAGWYMELAHLSGILPKEAASDGSTGVTVTRWLLAPAEFRETCGREPPANSIWVMLGHVTRSDGVAREVVVGDGNLNGTSGERLAPVLLPQTATVGPASCFLRDG